MWNCRLLHARYDCVIVAMEIDLQITTQAIALILARSHLAPVTFYSAPFIFAPALNTQSSQEVVRHPKRCSVNWIQKMRFRGLAWIEWPGQSSNGLTTLASLWGIILISFHFHQFTNPSFQSAVQRRLSFSSLTWLTTRWLRYPNWLVLVAREPVGHKHFLRDLSPLSWPVLRFSQGSSQGIIKPLCPDYSDPSAPIAQCAVVM